MNAAVYRVAVVVVRAVAAAARRVADAGCRQRAVVVWAGRWPLVAICPSGSVAGA